MLDNAAGCMPDGTVFSIPQQDQLPIPYQPLDLSRPESHDFYLALPVISNITCEIEGRQSAGQGTERYRLVRADVRDLHSDGGTFNRLYWGSWRRKSSVAQMI